MPGQILPAQLRDEIVQIVIELPVIADVAARAGSAVASHIWHNDQEVVGRKRLAISFMPVEWPPEP